MQTILVDDEIWMMEQFEEECSKISDIKLIGKFRSPLDALSFASEHRIDLAFLDIEMPTMNGLELSQRLREIYPQIIIVFVSAYDQYMADAFINEKADYYLLKPYTKEDVESVLSRAKLLSGRLKKRISIHTFGRFNVYIDGKPLIFASAKAKELLALLVDRRGNTLSNEEAYYLLYENRPYDNTQSSVYRKVLRRLKDTLSYGGIDDILISQPREYRLNEELFDCDYYEFLDGQTEAISRFNFEYMSEYSWGEETLARLTELKYKYEEDI